MCGAGATNYTFDPNLHPNKTDTPESTEPYCINCDNMSCAIWKILVKNHQRFI